jgi:hypothetical protein
MRTDDLINLLVIDQPPPSAPLSRRLALALVAGLAVAAIGFFVVLGPRPDIASAVQTPRFIFKIVEALLLAAAAVMLTLSLARPAADTRTGRYAMIAVPALLLAAIGIELLLVTPAQWGTRLVGSNSRVCLTAIPLLSLPLLAAALYALREGAPTRPGIAGAVAGLLAGGMAASLYAIHCPDDSPLFVATWYSIAIAGVSLLGAVLGRRLLRW